MSLSFDYAREQLQYATEVAANNIAWIIAKELGKHIGNDETSVRARERLQLALEEFLRS